MITAILNLAAALGLLIPGFTYETSPVEYFGHPGHYFYVEDHAFISESASDWVVMHEACHSHQDYQVLWETGRNASFDYEWLATDEARAYQAVVDYSAYRWPAEWLSADTLIEDYANACGLYFVSPDSLYRYD